MILAAACLALAIKMALAMNTYGSTDSAIWAAHLEKTKADGVLTWYRDGVTLGAGGRMPAWVPANHPPAMVSLLAAWDRLSHATGLPLRFWVRLTSSLADLGTILLLLGISGRSGKVLSFRALMLIALSPVAIMVSGFHVNTDPIMIFLLLASVYVIEQRMPQWVGAIAFGLAMSVKIMPVIFAPAFLLYLPSVRRRITFMLLAGAVFTVGCMPYILQDPILVINRIFGYTPHAEYWGLGQMIYLFLPEMVYAGYIHVGKALVALVLLFASWRLSRSNPRSGLFVQLGCIGSLFLFWAPGFGYQYLSWLVPWSAGVLKRSIPSYYFASAAFLGAVYTVWSRGLPWYFANTLDRGIPISSVLLMAILGATCWVSIGSMAHSFWQSLVSDREPRQPREPQE